MNGVRTGDLLLGDPFDPALRSFLRPWAPSRGDEYASE